MKLKKVFGKIWIGPGDEVKAVCHKFMGGDVDLGDLPIHKGPSGYAILDVADDYPEYPHPRDVMFLHAGLNDGDDNSIYAYIHALSALQFLENGPWDVFVHCHEGVSQSCFVVAVYIATVLRIPYFEAKEMLHKLYPREHIHPKHDPFADELIQLNLEMWS